MGSRYLDVNENYQDVASQARDVLTDALTPLVNSTKYTISVSPWQPDSVPAGYDAAVYLALLASAPTTAAQRARGVEGSDYHARLDKIMEITRHTNPATVLKYIRDADAFTDHAGAAFL